MIAQGEFILLRAEGGREYFTSVGEEKLHTDLGIVDLKEIAGKDWGDIIDSHLGKHFSILRPRTPDFFRHIRRTGAPMMPKDIGAIIAYTGICPADTVLDAGTGSGVLAIYLGTIAKKVITYEINEQFAAIARKNVANAGLTNVEVRHGDLAEEINNVEGPFDVITLDMQEAAKVVPGAYKLLRPGGFLATYSPVFRADQRDQVCSGNGGLQGYFHRAHERARDGVQQARHQAVHQGRAHGFPHHRKKVSPFFQMELLQWK